jgi:hypothetical protein
MIYKTILVILHFPLKLGGSIVTAHLNFLKKNVDAIAVCAFAYSFLASCGYLTIGSKVNPNILLDYDANRPKVTWMFSGLSHRQHSQFGPISNLSKKSIAFCTCGFFLVIGVFVLKVALSQKILKNFFVAKINIPNHYPEQKI